MTNAEPISPTAAALPESPGADTPGSPVADTPGSPLSVTVIEPRASLGLHTFAELWRFRELLLFLVWRDVKIRYKQTVVGVFWALLQPVAVMGVMVFALGRVAGQPGAVTPYWLFVLAGLVPWTFLAAGVSGGGMSVVANQQLVTKVYFPRVLLPLSAAGVAWVDFLVGCGVLALAVGFSGVELTANLLVLPLVLMVLTLIAAGFGLLLAAVTVTYRDFRVVLPLLTQLWLFLTPVIYVQVSGVFGPVAEAIQLANPAHGAIAAFRASVLGTEIDWVAFGSSAAVGIVLFGFGLWYFHKAERKFADVI